MRNNKTDSIDTKFGRWTVIGEQFRVNYEAFYLCRCECGVERNVRQRMLRNGRSLSCGCYHREFMKNKLTKTGLSHTPEEKRARRIRKEYGVTTEDFDRMYDEQLGRCAICLETFAEKQPHIDHDHTTMFVRGLLCSGCNLGLGQFTDDINKLQKAITYLMDSRNKFGVAAATVSIGGDAQ